MDAMFSGAMFLLLLLCLFAGSVTADEKAQALFAFGDSFADTGNHNPYNQSANQSWRRPYGFTWPGYPAGRFSSGKIQTDFWVIITCCIHESSDILGLPTPISYELLRSHDCSATSMEIRQGVNFAVGGSGIFRSFGFTTVPEQVEQFKKLIALNRGFDSHKLSQSVVLISVAGNDYAAFTNSRNGSIEGLISLVKPVVSGTIKVVKDLYKCGLRNFVVSNIGRFGCEPEIGRTSCDSKYDNILSLHTKLLRKGAQKLRSNHKGLSIIISDLVSAYDYIFSHPTLYGFVDLFIPCCAEKGGVEWCGEVDERGEPLFEVCNRVEEKFIWDYIHPTQKGWFALMSLYGHGADMAGENVTLSFIEGAPNAIRWVESLGFRAYNISLP